MKQKKHRSECSEHSAMSVVEYSECSDHHEVSAATKVSAAMIPGEEKRHVC